MNQADRAARLTNKSDLTNYPNEIMMIRCRERDTEQCLG